MNDKELLELAAKAAGIKGEYTIENRMIREFCFGNVAYIRTKFGEWNPLADDGDALRLAVKMRLDIFTFGASDSSGGYGSLVQDMAGTVEEDVPHNGDPYAATRRAIVRAAAEIWRMK